jgi:hypothetical protein
MQITPYWTSLSRSIPKDRARVWIEFPEAEHGSFCTLFTRHKITNQREDSPTHASEPGGALATFVRGICSTRHPPAERIRTPGGRRKRKVVRPRPQRYAAGDARVTTGAYNQPSPE